jgi:DNA-binding transcriptional MerR regulator
MQGKKYTIPKLLKSSQRNQSDLTFLPPIPEKRYFTIGEAALLCCVKPHVLRFWEQEFLQLKPSKRRGNRRYYQYSDVVLVRQIRSLLYENGFTIEGARAQLAQQTIVIDEIDEADNFVKKVIADLETVLQNLQTADDMF